MTSSKKKKEKKFIERRLAEMSMRRPPLQLARRPNLSMRDRLASWVGTFSAEDEATMTSLGAEFLCAFALPATYVLYGMHERISTTAAWPLTVMLFLGAFFLFRSAAIMAIRKTDEDDEEVSRFLFNDLIVHLNESSP
jgi:hypothetical protein